ncbi:MAG TPA: esterase-like activity of phytase family protein [Oscillatoriaceae cyanobacterium M33_DOE_052]|nr:esterase-like activity of phytase family protein [Oscillatoriaceae cyanobacterium M33_DOE_052]
MILPKLWRKLALFLSGLFMATIIIYSSEIRGNTSMISLEFMETTSLPHGFLFENTEVGGFSGITYNTSANLYYSISDDRSQKSPARFYTLAIDSDQFTISPKQVTFLRNEHGEPFPPNTIDPESIALAPDGTLFITSEGDVKTGIAPFIAAFSRDGKWQKSLPIPAKFLPNHTSGVRNNLAFESLTITPNSEFLFTATENALLQDGPTADISTGSPCRMIKYNLASGQPTAEFLYITEPVAAPPHPTNGFQTNGLVELLAIDDTIILSLERSFSENVGNQIRIFEISLKNATDISDIFSLNTADATAIKPVGKRLIFDSQNYGFQPDNIEGFTFGAPNSNGQNTLILISDNNFSSQQTTQVVFLAIPG